MASPLLLTGQRRAGGVQDQLFHSQHLISASDICPAQAPAPRAFAHSLSLSISPLLAASILGRMLSKAHGANRPLQLATTQRGLQGLGRGEALLTPALTLPSARAFILCLRGRWQQVRSPLIPLLSLLELRVTRIANRISCICVRR